jgi:large subunit ribosomal protein L30
MAEKKLKVTLVKSINGYNKAHRATVKGLGLRRMNHTVEVQDTPETRGMIRAVAFLVRCEG